MFSFSGGNTAQTLTSAIALSVALAEGKSTEQLTQLAAFFTIVGDTLALFAAQPDNASGCTGQETVISPGRL